MQTHSQVEPTMVDIEENRRVKREAFLAKHLDMSEIEISPLPGDASFRRYYRLTGADRALMLMEDPPDRPPVPPFVMVEPFFKIATHLSKLGLSVPEILAHDMQNGLMLIEDFGDDTYTRLFANDGDEKALYEYATDVLSHLHQHEKRNDIDLEPYGHDALMDEAMLLMDWYYPAVKGQDASDELVAAYKHAWNQVLSHMPKTQKTIVLRDYHVDNLMYLPNRDGVSVCGLLDFQDALIGHFSYDLMSLLEDARRDVPQDLQEHLLKRYMDAMPAGFDKDAFMTGYHILAAQRHAKVVGIFVRLFKRDGKEAYLDYLPHVQRLFEKSLQADLLKPVADVLSQADLNLTEIITAK